MQTIGSMSENEQSWLPPGFRFHPTDEELVTHYLCEKVQNPVSASGFAGRAIGQADLNSCEPWDLPGQARMGEKEWYFYTVRDRKYPTGMRTNRATRVGYWKATGKDREIVATNSRRKPGQQLIGMKKTLVFYKGRAPKGEKTNWVMHEYRLEGSGGNLDHLPKSSKDKWALCRVFLKGPGGKKMSIDEIRKPCIRHDDVTAGPSHLPALLESPQETMVSNFMIPCDHPGSFNNDTLTLIYNNNNSNSNTINTINSNSNNINNNDYDNNNSIPALKQEPYLMVDYEAQYMMNYNCNQLNLEPELGFDMENMWAFNNNPIGSTSQRGINL